MSIKKFPNYMYEIVNLGGETNLGGYTIDADGEISNLYPQFIFYRTDLFSAERIRLRVVRSSFPSTPIFSDWMTISSISNLTDTNYWIGRVRFDFSREQLGEADTYQLYLETENYTHSHTGTQIGTILEYINSSGQFEITNNTATINQTFSYR